MLKKRKILVTGATRGIGRSLVKQLCSQGATVFATGRDEALLSSLTAATGCLGNVCDLKSAADVNMLYDHAKDALGGIDVLVNNAGFNPGKKPVTEVDIDALDASYAVNFRAPFILSRKALLDMMPRRQGHIINVVSTIARTSAENYSAYCSMKYALHGFTLCLIKEARHHHVKVTAVYPGGTDTDFRPEDRPDYMQSSSAARLIVDCIKAPDDAVVHELVYRPMVESNF